MVSGGDPHWALSYLIYTYVTYFTFLKNLNIVSYAYDTTVYVINETKESVSYNINETKESVTGVLETYEEISCLITTLRKPMVTKVTL